jgi:hypothetical protein
MPRGKKNRSDKHAGFANLQNPLNHAGSDYNVKGAVTLICQITGVPRDRNLFLICF